MTLWKCQFRLIKTLGKHYFIVLLFASNSGGNKNDTIWEFNKNTILNLISQSCIRGEGDNMISLFSHFFFWCLTKIKPFWGTTKKCGNKIFKKVCNITRNGLANSFIVFKSFSEYKFFITLTVVTFANKMCKFYHILPARCII